MRGGDITKTKEIKRYLEQLKKRYYGSKRKEKQIILDEFTKTTGYTRKHAIHLLRGKYKQKGFICRPHRIYTERDAAVLEKVCSFLDWINSKRIKAGLAVGIDQLIAAGELRLSRENKKRILGISPSTIDRLLTRHNRRPKTKGHSYTKSGTLLKSQIPIRTFADWNENMVGFCEIDLVGHDGGVARGDFSWTLNFVDVKSAWTEQVAVFNKAQIHVFAGIKTVRGRLLFPLLGIDSDSGSEFINNQLYRYSIAEKLTFTRSRPGKKNDNAYVEQKNDSVVRRWVGYGRYDTQEQVDTLNELYDLLRLYTNCFLPVMKLKKKIRFGSKVTKIYDKPATPYLRILGAKDVSNMVRSNLRDTYSRLNLVYLKKEIDSVLLKLKPTKVG